MRLLLTLAAILALPAAGPVPIDRHALVERHAVTFTTIDRDAPAMIGNGEIAFTADITGLQTFPEQYARQAPLLTMAQWAWHSFPPPRPLDAEAGLVQVPVPGRGSQPYAYVRDLAAAAKDPVIAWLRENPHRFSLGRVSLDMHHADGRPVRFEDLTDTVQHLDLWTGTLTSRFRLDGEPVTVTTRVHPDRDMLLVEVRSPLVASGRVAVRVAYPGVSRAINPDPSDWAHPEAYRTRIIARRPDRIEVRNRIDQTVTTSSVTAPGGTVIPAGAHRLAIRGHGDRLVAMVGFGRSPHPAPAPDYARAVAATERHWRDYWTHGGIVDFSSSRDPRAAELERRVVLSQYLAAINEAGSLPPQEEGLFSNSWNGKFHLEMHPWHSAHFASWGHPALLERSLEWYRAYLPDAIAEGRRHGLNAAAWWPKMSGPEGRNSPSPINPFILWQQPHPIYLAELVWRAHPDRATLDRYAPLVEATANMLAGWPRLDPATGRYHIGPPVVPVQENHDPFTTADPAFEVEYFRWGLDRAQAWRERRGLARNPQWDKVIAGMAAMPMQDRRYVPVAGEPGFWARAASPECRGDARPPLCTNRDHPSFLMPFGLIGSARVDRAAMARTLAATDADWDMRQLWGWDFPMIAMTAARLGRPEEAVDWLLRDAPNNRWGATGMTPRFDLAADGKTETRLADTYFPSNGALLLAVGMMAAGWQGSTGHAPGFPAGWSVRVEGIRPLP